MTILKQALFSKIDHEGGRGSKIWPLGLWMTPLDNIAITSWEQRYSTMLPNEIKDFFLGNILKSYADSYLDIFWDMRISVSNHDLKI